MRKVLLGIIGCLPLLTMAQGATDVYQMSQTELRGTARFMSMAGAFGALGGDMSVLGQNPGGIGVYRSSDISLTLDFDAQSVAGKNDGVSSTTNQFKFNCNSAGYIGALQLDSETMPNINWGFSYSRPVSYNRHYRGRISSLNTSLSNYEAGLTNKDGWKAGDLAYTSNYNPYYDSNAPWMSILGYDSYMMNVNGNSFQGLYGDGTTGYGEFESIETGGVNEFNINWGGNIANVLYWGMGFGITDLDYRTTTYYGESLNNAYVNDGKDNMTRGMADYGLVNDLHTFGTGYNFKMGVIVKPVNEFRLGFAFHTPTYYSLKDEIYTEVNYSYYNAQNTFNNTGYQAANDGYVAEGWYKINTPWRFIASAAAVVAKKAIISFDYEYVGYNTMEYLSNEGRVDPSTKNDIQDYYTASNIFRIGAEYRVSPQFSVRGGYSYQSSPVNENALNNRMNITTSSTMPSYCFDKSTQYITAGIGYRYQSFYTDVAYVHKTRESEYHAFSPVVTGYGPYGMAEDSPTAKITDNNNQIVWTMGFRF